MSITRRLTLSILAGGCATVIPLGVGWTAPKLEAKPRMPAFSIPRGVVVQYRDVNGYQTETFSRAAAAGLIAHPVVDLVSNGRELVLLESEEGEATARESAVNLRSDGTIRHRQHHWPR